MLLPTQWSVPIPDTRSDFSDGVNGAPISDLRLLESFTVSIAWLWLFCVTVIRLRPSTTTDTTSLPQNTSLYQRNSPHWIF